MAFALTAFNISKRFRVQRNRPTTLRESVQQFLTGGRDTGKYVWALHDVSFAVEHGKVFGIIGHNGAGKSTLLRLLCGLGRPTSGSISRDGQVSGILELGGGFHPDLTGRQNIATVALLNGLTTGIKERAQCIIDFAEMEEFIDQPVKTYSSGMYLRLAFAAAIEFDPAVLVIDEVLAVGDERFQKKCIERISAFRKASKTLIVTSHDAEQIKTLCDQVLVLEKGRVVMQNDPKSALACYYDLMRQRTDERVSQIHSTPKPSLLATSQGSREGTQEASISSVRIYDVYGKPSDSVRTGDCLAVEIDIETTSLLADMACIVGIFNETHVKCLELAVPSMCKAFGSLRVRETVRWEIDALPLVSGRYFLNVGLYPIDWSYKYDYHWQMHPIVVCSDCSVSSGIYVNGVVHVNSRCHLKADS